MVIVSYLLVRGQFLFAVTSRAELLYLLILGLVNTDLLCYVNPLLAVAFAAMFFCEQLTGVQVLGAVLILGGALVGELSLTQLQHKNGPSSR